MLKGIKMLLTLTIKANPEQSGDAK